MSEPPINITKAWVPDLVSASITTSVPAVPAWVLALVPASVPAPVLASVLATSLASWPTNFQNVLPTVKIPKALSVRQIGLRPGDTPPPLPPIFEEEKNQYLIILPTIRYPSNNPPPPYLQFLGITPCVKNV